MFELKRELRNDDGDPGNAPPVADPPQSDPPPQDFIATLPEEYRADPTFGHYKSLADLCKSHKHAQRSMGKDKIAYPGKNGTDEEWSEFFGKIRPGDPKEYEFKKPDEKAFFKPDDSFMESMKQAMHKAGLSKRQAAQLYDHMFEHENSKLAEIQKHMASQKAEQLERIDKTFGAAAEMRKNLARAASEFLAERVGMDKKELQKFYDESQLGNNLELIQLLSGLGQMLAEDDPTGTFGLGHDEFPVYDPKQAHQMIQKKYKDPEFMQAMRDPNHKNHDEYKKELNNLYQQAYGGAK